MDQGVELSVWIGIAGLALVWANVHLWHTGRVLNRPRQGTHVPEVRLAPAAVPVPALVAAMASSVISP
jgi:hypothetical protein